MCPDRGHRDLQKLLVVLICMLGVLGSAGRLAAQVRERTQPNALPAAPEPGGGGGFGFFAATEGGYDTNLDNRVLSRASPFEMVQLGAKGSYKPDDLSAYSFYLSSRDFWYNDLPVSQRYDVDAAVGARYDFSSNTALKLGASYYKDAISLDRYDYYNGYADLVNEGDLYRLRVKLDSHTEVSTNTRIPISTDPAVIAATSDKAFDFTKNSATTSLLLLRNQMIAPFIVGNIADIDYFQQVDDPLINRTGREFWGIAGARFTLNPDFSVDLGGRYNHRNFDDLHFTQFTSSYPDLRLTWHATDGLTFRGIVERQIKEPTTTFGLADDVITYEVNFDQKFEQWTIRGRAWLDHLRPIGDPFNYYKYNWFLGVGYAFSKNTELFAEYFGRHVVEKITDLGYERTRVGAGVRVTF
ncbi:MAG TPA: outer membrane beta-barrel protein [Xanthobacteraceae bacterium]|nr:outer membrane beta-barrel protein [Xanthobacteraceae bacterium]